MSESIGNLSGTTIRLTPDDHMVIQSNLDFAPSGLSVEATLVSLAREAGARIVTGPLQQSHDNENEFRLSGSPVYPNNARKAVQTEQLPKIAFPSSKDVKDCTDDDFQNLPFVAASDEQCGRGKYLIESPDQAQRLQAFSRPADDAVVSPPMELREYVPTPGDRYTSFRILTAPTGDILAAGLLYSGHRKTQRRVTVDGFVPCAEIYRHINQLESPTSPYFFDALDIRSNIAQGGHCIPLTGIGAERPKDDTEQAVLISHGMYPDTPQLPKELADAASHLGRTAGKAAGLVCGQDYLMHARTGDFYFLEGNTTPGIKTYEACHYQTPGSDKHALRLELLSNALRRIAGRHS